MPRKWRLNLCKHAKALGWVRFFKENTFGVMLRADSRLFHFVLVDTEKGFCRTPKVPAGVNEALGGCRNKKVFGLCGTAALRVQQI